MNATTKAIAAGATLAIGAGIAAIVWPRRGGMAQPMGLLSPADPSFGSVQIPHGPSTRGATRDDWMRDRLAVLRAYLRGRVPAASSEPIAHAFLAQMWRETGRQNEYWYNVGNLRAFPAAWHRPYWTITDQPDRPRFRAYPSLAAGVEDYLRLISRGSYADAWNYLASNPTEVRGWYERLLNAGYSPLDDRALDEIESLRNRVDQWAAANA